MKSVEGILLNRQIDMPSQGLVNFSKVSRWKGDGEMWVLVALAAKFSHAAGKSKLRPRVPGHLETSITSKPFTGAKRTVWHWSTPRGTHVHTTQTIKEEWPWPVGRTVMMRQFQHKLVISSSMSRVWNVAAVVLPCCLQKNLLVNQYLLSIWLRAHALWAS